MPDTRYCPKCGEPCGWEDRFCSSCRTELRPTTPRPRSGTPDALDELSSSQTELGLPPNALLLNRYQIRKELGAGGMGRVYMAEDQKLGIPVAIKVLRDILRQDPGSVKRLITEAKASIMLAHPNIVRLHNFEDGETTKFLVMEFVDGETLAHRVAREGKLSEEDTRRIAIEICRGLEHAHLKKVIHRDLKPGNILLGKDGSIKIADFGIARLCRDSMSRLTSQQDSGTLLYMSPEQLDGESGEASDLYSLGVVLYEMLSGDPPFITGEITAQIRYKAAREITGISPEMNRIVLKCLEKKPANRFDGIRQLREELEGSTEHRRQQKAESEKQLESIKAEAAKASNEGRYPDAIALWEQALGLQPGDTTLNNAMAQARARQADVERQEAAARRAMEEKAEQNRREEIGRKQRLEALKAKGQDALNAGKFGEAIAAWQEALALDPGDAGLKEAIAAARIQADRLRKEYEKKQVEEAKRKWADTIAAQCNALLSQGKYREAEAGLLQALQHDPGNEILAGLLAMCREKMKEAEQSGKQTVIQQPPLKKKRFKIILAFAIVAAVFLLSVIIYVVLDSYDSSSSSTSGGTGGGGSVVNPPPPPPILDVAGRWAYTVTVPDGRSINGQMQIASKGDQVMFVAEAAYSMLWSDGLIHQFREQSNWVGSLNGQSLAAQSTQATFMMDGIPLPPQGLPWHLNLTVSSDGSSMQGQIGNAMGQAGGITARRFQ